MTKSLQETLVGLCLVAIAVVALISINTGPDTVFESGRKAAMTSKTFPTILAIGLGALSALFTFRALGRYLGGRSEGTAAGIDFAAIFNRHALIALAVIALLVAYAMLIRQVHFALLTWGFLFAGFFLFGQRRLVVNAIVAACGAAAFYGLFVFVLELPLNP